MFVCGRESCAGVGQEGHADGTKRAEKAEFRLGVPEETHHLVEESYFHRFKVFSHWLSWLTNGLIKETKRCLFQNLLDTVHVCMFTSD